MKKLFVVALCLWASVASFGQDEVILTINDEPIYKSEFETIFRKNHQKETISKEDLTEYSELFINFKLKVAEAKALGRDTLYKFKNELLGYRKQLARPYLTDAEVNEQLIRETFERSREEIRAYHILLRVAENATPEDTARVYAKILDLKNQAEMGADFSALAKKHSEDPSAKQFSGDLGYFTAMQMVYPFETAAYNTPVGEYSDIIRTRFGYHVLWVKDRRPARGKAKVQHILISNSRSNSQKISGRDKALEIIDSLNAGADFSLLAKQYSDDRSSRAKGGELPWFGTGKMVPAFEDAAFELEVGAISRPVNTRYGWHIIKKIDEKPLASYEEMLPTIKNKISKDNSRRTRAQESFVNGLKKEYNFQLLAKGLKPFYKHLDTLVFSPNYAHSKLAKLKKPVFTFADQVYTQADLYHDLQHEVGERKAPSNMVFWLVDFVKREAQRRLIAYEDSRLEEKYPEFKALLQEYHDGILLFDLTNDSVWNKAIVDTAGLAAFFNKHRSEFMWEDRVDATLFKLSSEKWAKKTIYYLNKGWDTEKIQKKINGDSQLNCQTHAGVFEKKDLPELEHFEWKKGVSKMVPLDGTFGVLHVKQVLEPSEKELKDAKGPATAKYQDYLEQQWIKSLREKYTFSLDTAVLYSIQ